MRASLSSGAPLCIFMGMKKAKHNDDKLTKVFGLIARSSMTSVLVLSHSLLPVASVMASVEASLPEQEFYKRHPGIRPEEIRALKAYFVRFGSNLEQPQELPPGPKSLLLDENIPYTLIPLVTQQFGYSSHVEAEGFSRQNHHPKQRGPVSALDGLIARFAADNQFGGLVTHDTDFAALYKYPTHPVRGINVFLLEKGRHGDLSIEQRLLRSQYAIRRQLAAPTKELILI